MACPWEAVSAGWRERSASRPTMSLSRECFDLMPPRTDRAGMDAVRTFAQTTAQTRLTSTWCSAPFITLTLSIICMQIATQILSRTNESKNGQNMNNIQRWWMLNAFARSLESQQSRTFACTRGEIKVVEIYYYKYQKNETLFWNETLASETTSLKRWMVHAASRVWLGKVRRAKDETISVDLMLFKMNFISLNNDLVAANTR